MVYTKIDKRIMDDLRVIFPKKDGKGIVRTVNKFLLDENGNLIIDENKLEHVMIGDEEFAVVAEMHQEDEKKVLEIKEMFYKL